MPISESELYQADIQFCLYQDRLRWSRFQTAAALEAGLVYLIWGTKGVDPLSILIVSIGGWILAFILAIISQIDAGVYSGHLERIKALEKKCTEFQFEVQKPRLVPEQFRGWMLMPIAWLLILLFNLLLIIHAVCGFLGV